MGLWKEVRCPMCGKEGAVKFLWMVKCPMRGCPNHDYALEHDEAQRETSHVSPRTGERTRIEHRGSFDPGEHALTIFYTNYLDEEREFIADWRTLMTVGQHVSACIVPTGTRCAFKVESIDNFGELEPHLERLKVLNKTERRILARYLAQGRQNRRLPKILEKMNLAE